MPGKYLKIRNMEYKATKATKNHIKICKMKIIYYLREIRAITRVRAYARYII